MFTIPKAYLLKLNNIDPDSIQAKTMSGGDWAALRDAAEETVTIADYRRAKEAEVAEAIKPFLTDADTGTKVYLGGSCWTCHVEEDLPWEFGEICLDQYTQGLEMFGTGLPDHPSFGPALGRGYLHSLCCLTDTEIRFVMNSYGHAHGLDGYDD